VARALFFLGSPDDAKTELLQAVRDDNNLEPADVSMGRLWTVKGDTVKAKDAMDAAVKKEPNNGRVHRAYGGWLLEQGRLSEASVHIGEALKIDPKDKEAERLRGLLARHTKDYDTAEKIFEGQLRESPADFFSSNQLALTLVDQDSEPKKSRAKRLAEVNARQYQKSGEALATLGWVYLKISADENMKQEALKLLGASVSGGQATSDMAYYLAMALKKAPEPSEEKDKAARADQIMKLLQGASDSKGMFVNRKDAEDLLAEYKKKYPTKDPKDKDKAKDKDKDK